MQHLYIWFSGQKKKKNAAQLSEGLNVSSDCASPLAALLCIHNRYHSCAVETWKYTSKNSIPPLSALRLSVGTMHLNLPLLIPNPTQTSLKNWKGSWMNFHTRDEVSWSPKSPLSSHNLYRFNFIYSRKQSFLTVHPSLIRWEELTKLYQQQREHRGLFLPYVSPLRVIQQRLLKGGLHAG